MKLKYFLFLFFLLFACTKEDDIPIEIEPPEEEQEIVKYEVLKEYDFEQLKEKKKRFYRPAR